MWFYIVEIYLLIGVSSVIVYGSVYLEWVKKDINYIIMLILVIGGLLCIDVETYSNGIITDSKWGLSIEGKMLTCIFGSVCLFFRSQRNGEGEEYKFEYGVLVLLICFGLVLLMNSNDLISMYLGVELQSLGLYVLASYRKNSSYATESGLKYYIIGSFGSGLLLFGSSLLYGSMGTLNLNDMGKLWLTGMEEKAWIGLLLVIVGLLFKLGAAPFHMWIIDVIEGASMRISKLFSVVPKIGVLIMLMRVLLEVPILVWQDWLIMVSMGSMIVSVCGGFYQRKVKRFLAYSGIGHIGYVLMGVSVGIDGIESVLIYMSVYMLTSFAVWSIVESNSIVYIEEIGKICRRNKYLGVVICLLFFSMSGIPPLGGFFIKVNLIIAALEHELYVLSVVGLLCTVIGGFNYLRWIKVMYYESIKECTVSINTSKEYEALIKGSSVMVLSVMWLFAF